MIVLYHYGEYDKEKGAQHLQLGYWCGTTPMTLFVDKILGAKIGAPSSPREGLRLQAVTFRADDEAEKWRKLADADFIDHPLVSCCPPCDTRLKVAGTRLQ